jgi:hypothetical protein
MRRRSVLLSALVALAGSRALGAPTTPSIIAADSVKVSRSFDDDAPGVFKLTVSVSVLTGANKCTAENHVPELEVAQEGSVIYISPEVQTGVIDLPEDPVQVRCPFIYLPIYKPVTVTIVVDTGLVTEITLHNVGTNGHDESLYRDE